MTVTVPDVRVTACPPCPAPDPHAHRRGDFWPCPRCDTWWRLARPHWWQRGQGGPEWLPVAR